MNNKKGLGGLGIFMVALLFVLVVGGVYFAVTQSGIGKGSPTEGCPDSTATLTVALRSALDSGTAPTIGASTLTCGVNGGPVTTNVTSGTSTFPVGAELNCLVSEANYIDKAFNIKSNCGGTTLDAPLYYSTSDNPVITWYNDDDNAMTDSFVGSSNQTDLTAGETFTLKLKLQGTNGESSGDGVLVVEFPAGSGANISSVTLDGQTPISIPTIHTLQNAGSKAVAFNVPAVVGGAVVEKYLQVTLSASKDLMGGVYTDWYAKQDFIDTNSKITNGVENADGTAKYENTEDSDFFIDAS